MLSIISAITFGLLIIMSLLLLAGLPLGELTMGGQYKIIPPKMRIILVFQMLLQGWFLATILQLGGHIPFWFPINVTKVIGIVMAVFLSLNTVMNAISKSKKEKLIMTPLSAYSAICFWILSLQL